MFKVGSWLYGKKPGTASTQSLDSLTELRDCEYPESGTLWWLAGDSANCLLSCVQ